MRGGFALAAGRLPALGHILDHHRPAVAAAASAALHAAFAVALVVFAAAPLPAAHPPESIEVELVMPRESGPAPPSAAPAPAAIPAPALPPPDLTAAPSETMIRATRLYSANSLADPKNRPAREALPLLAPAERMEQLCAIEAMDQVHAWKASFEPERLVAYAFAGTQVSGNSMHADGAAFRSGGRWFGLRFDCALSADGRKVVAFAFEVGDPVPVGEWEAHDLPALE